MFDFEVFDLVAHLQKCPDVYLQSSVFINKNGLDSVALLSDTCRFISSDYLKNKFEVFYAVDFDSVNDEHWRTIHISLWLLNYQSFENQPAIENRLKKFWFNDLKLASIFVKHSDWILDEERAEEMVRLLLYQCQILPFGESEEEAADILSSLNSAERHDVLENTYNKHARVMEIKKHMAEKKAREAANTYGRE